MKVAYIKHPAKREDVEKALNGGYRIIDLKFKPSAIGEDDIVLGEDKPKRTRKTKASD